MLKQCSSSLELAEDFLNAERHILLFGESGSGKSTLAKQLAQPHQNSAIPCYCLGADPGSPAFGLPGAICLARWQQDYSQQGYWQLQDYEALCSLDAGRFRLPLIALIRKLLARKPAGALIVDAPGVVRGVGGAELLVEIIAAAQIDLVLALSREGQNLPLDNELQACQVEVVQLAADRAAHRLSKPERSQRRSRMWQRFLTNASTRELVISNLNLLGTPPPLDAEGAWEGRQIALLQDDQLRAMGEVITLNGETLCARFGGRFEYSAAANSESSSGSANQLVIRDAVHSNGVLHTAKRDYLVKEGLAKGALTRTGLKSGSAKSLNLFVEETQTLQEQVHYSLPKSDSAITKGDSGGSSVVARVGQVIATLVNGVMGDPLLHLQLLHQRRSLLFDLGDPGRMSARIAHQVSDVFISHTHADHIGGFLWLLRSRIGEFPPCRFYGPPGLAKQVAGMVGGILWDRVEHRGPCFEIHEVHGDQLRCWRVTAGREKLEALDHMSVDNGVIYRDPSFCVRTALLDHGTAVLAYAFEPAMQIKVRQDQLKARGLRAGRWLQELKFELMQGNRDSVITFPDGSERPVEQLADELLLLAPGQKLVYATDFADTRDNQTKLVDLAKGAHTFFCEASFIAADSDRATHTRHLTTSACGRIATAAEVAHLVPFHFSKRYGKNLDQVYKELRKACAHTEVPPWFSEERTSGTALFQ